MILDPAIVGSWHAHVYFNADSRDAAWALREQALAAFGDSIEMGRFHERPVGPHPQWSYQPVSYTHLDVYKRQVLNTGRLQHQWHTLTKTGKVPMLNKLCLLYTSPAGRGWSVRGIGWESR